MIVGFLHVNCGQPQYDEMARLMVLSVRQNIPDAHIVQMTSVSTPRIANVDEKIAMDTPEDRSQLMVFRMKHLREFPYNEALFLDTDIIVQKNPVDGFKGDFDVALTVREPVYVDGVKREDMPYNIGVMYSKNRQFWADAYDLILKCSNNEKRWFGDQIAIAKLVKTGKYNVRELTCNDYNYSPSRADEDVSDKRIVHYKGKRKSWMLGRTQCAA